MENRIAGKLKNLLVLHQTPYKVLSHSEAFTAQETAQSEHVSGKEFAKTVMLRADGRMVMAVVPAQAVIDEDQARKSLAAATVRVAHKHEFQDLFPDCEAGAMPPFGNLYGVPVFAERALAANKDIVFNAGTHRTALQMAFKDYEALARPRICRLSAPPPKTSRGAERKKMNIPVDTRQQDRHFCEK